MWTMLRQIVTTGIVSEAAPSDSAALRVATDRIQHQILDILGQALTI